MNNTWTKFLSSIDIKGLCKHMTMSVAEKPRIRNYYYNIHLIMGSSKMLCGKIHVRRDCAAAKESSNQARLIWLAIWRIFYTHQYSTIHKYGEILVKRIFHRGLFCCSTSQPIQSSNLSSFFIPTITANLMKLSEIHTYTHTQRTGKKIVGDVCWNICGPSYSATIQPKNTIREI